jgi:hypothetical protein
MVTFAAQKPPKMPFFKGFRLAGRPAKRWKTLWKSPVDFLGIERGKYPPPGGSPTREPS